MAFKPIEDMIAEWFEKFTKIPEAVHLLCDRIEDGAGDTSSADPLKDRIRTTYWCCCMLAMDVKKYGDQITQLHERVEASLNECDKCLFNWHLFRKEWLEEFAETYNPDAVHEMERVLQEHDFQRLDHGLKWAQDVVEQVELANSVFKKTLLGAQLGPFLMTVYSGLFCLPYLKNPEKMKMFLFAFSRANSGKKGLKLGENIPLPGATYFLFHHDDNDGYGRKRFAETTWDAMEPNSMTPAQFDFAVAESLCDAFNSVKSLQPADPDNYLAIKRFWYAFGKILKVFSPEVVTHQLPALQLDMTLNRLLIEHMECKSEEVMLTCLGVFSALAAKSPSAFWAALEQPKPFFVVQPIMTAYTFRPLLSASSDLAISQSELENGPPSVSWLIAWINAVPVHEKTEACQSLLELIFAAYMNDDDILPAGKSALTWAVLGVLANVLDSFVKLANPEGNIFPKTFQANFASPNNLLHLNNTLNLVHRYKDCISSAARDGGEFDVQGKALEAVKKALMLDSRAFAEECKAIHLGRGSQTVVLRRSAELWLGFLDLLEPGSFDLAGYMLDGMFPLLAVEQFRPLRKRGDFKAAAMKGFNERFSRLADVLGTVLQRLCQFDEHDMERLLVSHHRVLIGFTVHAEDIIRQSAIELIKEVTRESVKSDAIVKILRDRPDVLKSFTFTINQVTRPPLETGMPTTNESSQKKLLPWGPQSHILSIGQDIITAFFDAAEGALRKPDLTHSELQVIFSWWSSQWAWIDRVFGSTEAWSFYVDIPVLGDFCRFTMELAELLIEQDGLFASALKADILNAEKNSIPEKTVEMEMLRRVLSPCSRALYGLVKMLRLRDAYLVSITVKIVIKVFERLHEAELEIEDKSRNWIYEACRVSKNGKFKVATNLSRQQKAELLVAADGKDSDDEIEFVSERQIAEPPKVKKQSTIDAWSKSGTRDDIIDLTKNLDRTSTLAQINQRQEAKSKQRLPLKLSSLVPGPSARDDAKIQALKESRQKAAEDKKKRDAQAIANARAIREAAKSEMMVDSSEDDGSNDEAEIREYFSQKNARDKAIDEAARQREKALREVHRGPVKKQRQALNTKDLRARVSPNMAPLHHAILDWDIFHEGNEPPGVACTQVANTYRDSQAYRGTFHPLLLSEAWRSFVTAMDETTSKPFAIKVSTRATVDGFIIVTSLMPVTENRERPVSEGDIVVISQAENPLDKNNRTVPHCLARVHGLKTEMKRGARSLVIEYRISPKNSAMVPGKDTVLHVVKITNMTTIEREYATLQALQFYDLRDEILSAKASPILKYGDQAVQSFMSNYHLNPGQAKAVLGAKDNDGFTLIQGPPGTGKTKTIIAMVGCLLTGSLGVSARPVVSAAGPAGAATAANGNGSGMKKLLVCAPSNAAVDELVLRLKQGVKTSAGNFHKINVIRLGRSDVINMAVKDVGLDELVNKRLQELNVGEKTRADVNKLHSDAGEIRDTLMALRSDLQIARDTDDRDNANRLQREIDKLVKQQILIGDQIDNSKKEDQSVSRMVEIKRREIQQDILSKADVLCATLSGSGHDMFKKLENVDFETVIIDEAAQCVELSALIPLKYGALKCILVGDPKQLPPTVLSQSAARFGYDQSLFVRMQRNHPTEVHLLDTQYRMHPLISLFPSNTFYDGRLVDGSDMASLRKQPWHASSIFGPYRFFDVKGVQAKGHRGQSLINVEELNVAMQLYERLRSDYRNVDFRRKIGIITPYKAQLLELRTRFTQRYGDEIFHEIEFNTTDAFQGRECEIIIFSCVRANPKGGIGFMTDIRRMNVGLTRAKSSLWILGDSDALSQGEFWSKLVDDSRRRNLYTDGNILALLRRPTEKNSMDWEPPSRTTAPAQKAYTQEVSMQDALPQGPRPQKQPPQAHNMPRTGVGQHGANDPTRASAKRTEGVDSRGIPIVASQPSKYTEKPMIQSTAGPTVSGDIPKKRASEGSLPAGHNPKRVCRSSAGIGFVVDAPVASQESARDRSRSASREVFRPESPPDTPPNPSGSPGELTSTSAGGPGRDGDSRSCSSPTPSATSGSEPDDEFDILIRQFDQGKFRVELSNEFTNAVADHGTDFASHYS